jgi:hypothetical protein
MVSHDFIHHPASWPIKFRRLWVARSTDPVCKNPSDIGLCFQSKKFVRPGTDLELAIAVLGETHHLTGRVVLIRHLEDGYLVGFWFKSLTEAYRARRIELTCQIEAYRAELTRQRGGAVSYDTAAREWLAMRAERFEQVIAPHMPAARISSMSGRA